MLVECGVSRPRDTAKLNARQRAFGPSGARLTTFSPVIYQGTYRHPLGRIGYPRVTANEAELPTRSPASNTRARNHAPRILTLPWISVLSMTRSCRLSQGRHPMEAVLDPSHAPNQPVRTMERIPGSGPRDLGFHPTEHDTSFPRLVK